MGFAAGEIPNEPRIDVAEQQFAALGTLSCTLDVIEDPLDLGAGKICVDEKSRLITNIIAESLGYESIADGRSSSALPDYGVIHRFARFFIPNDSW